MLKHIYHRNLTPSGRRIAARWISRFRHWREHLHLVQVRRKVWTLEPGTRAGCQGYVVSVNHGPSFYFSYRDIFINRIYHFEAVRPDPFILDCGSNIGISILYFKHAYPKARVVGFEADPTVYSYLHENVANNHLTDVHLIQAALGAREGTITFLSDGKYGSHVAEQAPVDVPTGWVEHTVQCHRLRDYLGEPVDFLKMNIEGAEWEVLEDSEDRLSQVREMVIEYHHLPGLPRTLHKLLELLDRAGFEYLINDFDSEGNSGVCPPFHLTRGSRYVLLIYARRIS